ncbi:hypothetical protein DEO72_LG1g1384 [Vigna unguiculata]|uniref:BIRD-IDD transcription factor fourth C2HC zinc finger domain-containing protein n=1 Tax=Vigna unguiculata TaxID=3917 RepID=A0A4D6KIN0_VIGUN|nr:hypothetical protein DEO72_LG1g1384 [Vigna unguiculata]
MICRRDSFITHRAFCDALSDENSKFNEAGQLQSMLHGSNLQPPMIPNLAASLPMKQPLPLPHELIAAIPAKPFNNNMAALPRSFSSTSSPSQLCSNSPNINMFEENAQTNMSATALLQKAAQMGATVNGNSNSMMTETGFSTSMPPPSYGVMNQHIHSAQQDLSQYNFHANGTVMDGGGNGMGGIMSGLDMFNAILDQSKALSKIIEQNNKNSYGGVLHAMSNGRSSSIDVGGTKGSEDVMTLDLLGIGGGGVGGVGGGGGDGSFFGGEQSELKIEYGEMSQIRIQGLNHFQQQTAAYEN